MSELIDTLAASIESHKALLYRYHALWTSGVVYDPQSLGECTLGECTLEECTNSVCQKHMAIILEDQAKLEGLIRKNRKVGFHYRQRKRKIGGKNG